MIAITGVNGFVGKNLVEQLQGKYKIKGFTRKDKLNFTGVDVLFHLACRSEARQSNEHVYEYTDGNIGIFTKVLDQAIKDKVKRFIYVSSIQAETEENVYAINKRACEKILQLVAPLHNMEYIILRPANLYGKYMDMKNANRNVVANFLKAIKEKKELPLLGDITKQYNFLYIGDAMETFELCINDRDVGKIFTLISSPSISVVELATLLSSITITWDWVKEQT